MQVSFGVEHTIRNTYRSIFIFATKNVSVTFVFFLNLKDALAHQPELMYESYGNEST